MVGILSAALLTTGVLSVQADEKAHSFRASVPGLNQSTFEAGQWKTISDMDGYLDIYEISGDNKIDGRAETSLYTSTGPWKRLAYDNRGYLLENSIIEGKHIQVRFSSDLTTYLPITVTGTFQGN